MRNKGEVREAQFLFAAASARTWPLLRRRDSGLATPSVRCPRCMLADEDAFHVVWGCSANEGEAVEKSQTLVAEATANSPMLPGLWLRGLPPIALRPHFEGRAER